ncbi:Tat pathway signal protein [Paenibacillus alvei]|uniref:Tat pathway signal protein n=1 Tax=Paenibacillus alvei TaxID=44250 RepID=A0AAP7A514_PAEAL|nr:Tat pathway signal protein [Paenibacillus alvei]MCY9582571.1 Tat pathway signal protein [Paenibacillus alvei]MCY9587858.1 Tat pathway signal protein [Paenibacillus alvei]NEZ42322.1 Tat pathway signal protein [Paenibacillus alvei]NOJ73093.1 Tat pathway signal protein [Paenibacillus alvei]
MAVPQLPNEIILMMASRDMRMHHYIWHTVRNNWLRLSSSAQQSLRNLGWEPPRPALNQNRTPILNNASGEDFLFMHRQMIAFVNKELERIGQPDYLKIEGWTNVPAPGDQDYPVPPAWNSDLNQVKSDSYYSTVLLPLENQFKDPDQLRNMSLGEMGARIEFTIHNNLHMRFASNPGQQRPSVAAENPEAIDSRWDNPQYDYLGDTYSSHVNPIFWKLHGWVDNRIEDWKNANEVLDIQWIGTWEGPTHHHHFADSQDHLNRAVSVLGENDLLPEFPTGEPTLR